MNRDAKEETSLEISALEKIQGNTDAVKEFWNTRYREVYNNVLEDKNELGRHGIISEFIVRNYNEGNILDVGCGTGILAQLLVNKKYDYTGIDISTEALTSAKHKKIKIKHEFINIRFEDFITDKKFDIIVLNEVLYYMNNDIAFTQVRKLIKEDGYLIVSLFNFTQGNELIPVVKTKIDQPFELSLFNKTVDFNWNIIGGRFKG